MANFTKKNKDYKWQNKLYQSCTVFIYVMGVMLWEDKKVVEEGDCLQLLKIAQRKDPT